MARPRARITAFIGVALAVLVAGAVILVLRDEAPAPARADRGRMVITLDDYRIRPQVIHASSSRPLTLEVRNAGRLAHSFRLRRENRLWVTVSTLKPGERAVVTRRLERGSYRMFDVLSNYEVLGMYGTVSVG
jgi:hypothetical protein